MSTTTRAETSNDPRVFYLRLRRNFVETEPTPQAFYDARPLIKDPGDEETPPTYYSEADGLILLETLRLYRPHTVALYHEPDGGGKPQHRDTLDKWMTDLPEDYTHMVFALTRPEIQIDEVEVAAGIAAAIQRPLREVLIPWTRFPRYVSTGAL